MGAFLLRMALGVVVGLIYGGHALAQDAAAPVGMTTENVGALFDAQVPLAMAKAGVAGSAVVVVKEGKVLFARGYGYADVERKTPVSPGATLFRIGSISKAVTYTAVMQLVEQGRIDLDADIARYLDFPVPATFSEPITMRNLMSHTAGFEETVKGRWVAPGQLASSRDYLVQQMPKRIFAPGKVPAYSSYGTTLAAYILERVAGESFDVYAERHIFVPLGMRHSSFAQPLPPRLAPMLSKGYDTGTGPARAFDTAQIAPAAGMSSTALDMARFMLAHLGDEAAPGPSLLRQETFAQMHSVQFRHHPAGPGMALGVYEMDQVAPRLIGHTGDIPAFHSGMYLLPEQRIGLFIVQNTAGQAMRDALLKVFSDRYFAPPPHIAAPSQSVGPDESEQVQGSYRTSWRFESSPLSLVNLLEQTVARMVRPGVLVIDTQPGPNGAPVEWRQVASGVWQSAANPQRRIYFVKNALGEWEMSSNRNPTYILQQVPWHQHKLVVFSVLLGSIVIVVCSLLAWPLAALLRLRSGPQAALSSTSRKVRNRMRLAGLLTLLPWVLYAGIGLIQAKEALFVTSPIFPMLLRVVQALAWLALASTIGALLAVSANWRRQQASAARHAYHVLFLLACTGAATMAWQGGLFMWNGKF
ncbi:serine hydrolase domain-containing protein [Massilia rubra]|uniref:serine hydrolase domain-containing protein n=1 Tax=Massilia rubra TaxID=2607910 RepID=UPI001421E740|nr:serine hydrolase domain-containing protein [Massilia rubra]